MVVAMEHHQNSAVVFITCMKSRLHGCAQSHNPIGKLTQWLDDNGLEDIVGTCSHGGEEYQPDIVFFSNIPDPNPPGGPDRDPALLGSTEPYYRIVVEVEIGNRNASQFREVGHDAVLDNDYGALFVVGDQNLEKVQERYFWCCHRCLGK